MYKIYGKLISFCLSFKDMDMDLGTKKMVGTYVSYFQKILDVIQHDTININTHTQHIYTKNMRRLCSSSSKSNYGYRCHVLSQYPSWILAVYFFQFFYFSQIQNLSFMYLFVNILSFELFTTTSRIWNLCRVYSGFISEPIILWINYQ